MQRAEDILRRSKPGKAMRADHENGRAAAIHLNCEVCAGGLGNAKVCQIQACFLWPYRPGDGSKNRDAGIVPTVEEYAAMLPQMSEEDRAEVRRRFVGGTDDDGGES